MRGSSSISLAVVAFGLTVFVSPASAADPKNVREAEQRFRQGVHLMAAGKPDEARVQFAEANGLVRSTDILWNLIVAEVGSAHYVEALNHAYQLLRDPKGAKEDLAYIRNTVIPQSESKVGLLDIEAPIGAQIEIDSREKAGHAPLLDPFAVPPGPHQVVVIDGDARLTRDVEVGAGERAHVTLGNVVAPPPSAGSAALAMASMEENAPPGPKPDPASAEAGPDASEQRRKRLVVTSIFAGGAVALAVGGAIVLGFASASHGDVTEAQNAHPPGTCPSAGCPDLSSAIDRERAEAITGYALLGGAALAGVGALVSWKFLTPRERPPASAIQILPALSPGSSGVVLRGRF